MMSCWDHTVARSWKCLPVLCTIWMDCSDMCHLRIRIFYHWHTVCAAYQEQEMIKVAVVLSSIIAIDPMKTNEEANDPNIDMKLCTAILNGPVILGNSSTNSFICRSCRSSIYRARSI